MKKICIKKQLVYLIFICIAFCQLYQNAHAQKQLNLKILSTPTKQPVSGAIVNVFNSDSLLVKTAIADATGMLRIFQLPDQLILHISSLGMKEQWINYSIKGSQLTDTVYLQMSEVSLTDVQVQSSSPPTIKMQNDNTLRVSVAGSGRATGSNLLDVLQTMPLVTFQGDQIALIGKPAVTVYIDGKIIALSGNDLTKYLESIPADQVLHADIITSPSARYDANGSGGVINIQLKKDPKSGLTGSETMSVGQGVYSRANSSANISYRKKNTALYSTFGYQYLQPFNHLVSQKDFYPTNGTSLRYLQDNNNNRSNNIYNARIGFDHSTKNSSFSILYTTNFTDYNRRAYNATESWLNGIPDNGFNTRMSGKEKTNNDQIAISLKKNWTKTKQLSVDIDISQHLTDWKFDYLTRYVTKDRVEYRQPLRLLSDQLSKLSIIAAKTDYVSQLTEQTENVSGLKISTIQSENDMQFTDISGPIPVIDNSRSGKFNYTEKVYAGYTEFSFRKKKFQYKAGLRAEYTQLNIDQIGYRYTDSGYLKLFPSASINWALPENKQLSITLNRRMDRPAYKDLNPIRNYFDPSFYTLGRPGLRPLTAWNAQTSLNMKKLSVSISYLYATDRTLILMLPESDTAKVIVEQPVNLSRFTSLNLTVIGNTSISKNWKFNYSITINKNHFEGFVQNNNQLNTDFTTFNANITQQIKLNKNLSSEVNYIYNSNGFNGFVKVRWQHLVNLSASLKLSETQTLRFAVTDLLSQQWPRVQSTYKTYQDNWYAQRDTRIFSIAFSMRFGNTKISADRSWTNAADEERRRNQ